MKAKVSLVIALLAGSVLSASGAENFIRNGSFEEKGKNNGPV